MSDTQKYSTMAAEYIRSRAPVVVDGEPEASPYGVGGEPYVCFRPTITAEGGIGQEFNSAEEAYKSLCHEIGKYVSGADKIIVRSWPKFIQDFDTLKFYGKCRLLAEFNEPKTETPKPKGEPKMKKETKGQTKGPVNQHKRMAEGEKITGMKKGGVVKKPAKKK